MARHVEVDLADLSPLATAWATASRAMDPAGRSLFGLFGQDAGPAGHRARRGGNPALPGVAVS